MLSIDDVRTVFYEYLWVGTVLMHIQDESLNLRKKEKKKKKNACKIIQNCQMHLPCEHGDTELHVFGCFWFNKTMGVRKYYTLAGSRTQGLVSTGLLSLSCIDSRKIDVHVLVILGKVYCSNELN